MTNEPMTKYAMAAKNQPESNTELALATLALGLLITAPAWIPYVIQLGLYLEILK